MTRFWPVWFGAVAGLSGCTGASDVMCTTVFETATVVAVDSANGPVAMGSVTTTLIRTGQPLVVTSLLDPVPGTYAILDDGALPHLQPSGDSIRVSIASGSASGSAVFFFDAPNGCHINKVSGPDTVVVR